MTDAFQAAHRARRRFATIDMLALRDSGLAPKEAAARLGVTRAAIYARCRAEGIVWGAVAGLARYDDETFKRLWLCLTIGTEEIAQSVGVTRQAVTYRAKRMGLPLRTKNRLRKARPEELAAMWRAGVRCADIARHFGMAHGACVSTAARHLGLPPRVRGAAGFRNGGWAENITLEQYLEEQLRLRLEHQNRKDAA